MYMVETGYDSPSLCYFRLIPKHEQGSYIARILGANHHEAAAAVHITLLSAYKGFDPDKTPLSELERFGMQKAQEYVACENGYAIIQKPKLCIMIL